MFVTNILVDHLNGHKQARSEFSRYARAGASVAASAPTRTSIRVMTLIARRSFLRTFDNIALDTPVAERAVALRRQYRIKLPDAIVWATAQAQNLLFVTRNTKDFPKKAAA